MPRAQGEVFFSLNHYLVSKTAASALRIRSRNSTSITSANDRLSLALAALASAWATCWRWMTTSVFKLAIWTEPGDDDGPDDWPDDGPGAGALGSSTGTFGKTMSSACSCPWPAGASCLRLSGRTSILIFFAGFSSGGLFKLKKKY